GETDGHWRHDERQPEIAGDLHGEPAGVGAEHVEDPMGEVDDAHEPEDDRQPERDEDQDAAIHQSDEQLRVPDLERVTEERQICWLSGSLGSKPSPSHDSAVSSPLTACTRSKKSQSFFIAEADLPLPRNTSWMLTWSQARICSGPFRYWNLRPSSARVSLSVS